MRLFDRYAAEYALKLTAEEQDAKDERRPKAATDELHETFRGAQSERSNSSSVHSRDSFILSPVG